jgi:hypothetical protein
MQLAVFIADSVITDVQSVVTSARIVLELLFEGQSLAMFQGGVVI